LGPFGCTGGADPYNEGCECSPGAIQRGYDYQYRTTGMAASPALVMARRGETMLTAPPEKRTLFFWQSGQAAKP
jgi:hypothetical protein